MATQRMIEMEYGEEEEERENFLPQVVAAPDATKTASTSRNTSRILKVGVAIVCFIIVLLTVVKPQDNKVADIEYKNFTSLDEEADPIGVAEETPDAPVTPEMTTPAAPVATATLAPTAPGFGKPKAYSSASYMRRGAELTPEQQERVDKQWGRWAFETRSNALPEGYPNNDVPRSKFPAGSWQTDPVYLKGFLESSLEYLETAREAMLHEYGKSKFDEPDVDFDERSFMFNLTLLPDRYSSRNPVNAGEASYETLLSLRKRLLHAVVTESEFRFVMGGHSASAAHGNHFQQSYTLQIQKVMEPILARLGVYFQAHNFGMGGLGTSQNALGARDLYGRCDVLMWDSGMTEKDLQSKDLFARVGLLTSQPVLWGKPDGGLYDQFGAGYIGTGAPTLNLPKTNVNDLDATPFWAQYMNCDPEDSVVCSAHKYEARCWVDRQDGFQPPVKQSDRPGGQAGWHPGNRSHQLQGRAIAWQLVTQLYEGLKAWSEVPNYELDDSAWHVTSDMDRIREGVLSVKDSPCYDYDLPVRLCHFPLRARSDMSPRRDPAQTSLLSIMKEGVKIPEKKPNLYDPPDAYNPSLYHPDIDIVHILQNGVDFAPNRARVKAVQAASEQSLHRVERQPITSQLEPGQGWGLNALSNPDACDGTWDSFCGRESKSCILYGHNDNRGGIMFDSLSGWMVFNLEKVRRGIVIVRMEYWLGAKSNGPTEGWLCENNSTSCADQNRRSLKPPFKFKCDDFTFEFAIDGKITSWNQDEWKAQRKDIQRVVPLWVLLDDEDWAEERDVEVAIRLQNCGREDVMQISHIYWA